MHRFFLQTYAYMLDFLVFLTFLYLFYTQGLLSESKRKKRAAENEEEERDGGARPNYNTKQIKDILGGSSKYKSRILPGHNSRQQPEAATGKNSIYLASINEDDSSEHGSNNIFLH